MHTLTLEKEEKEEEEEEKLGGYNFGGKDKDTNVSGPNTMWHRPAVRDDQFDQGALVSTNLITTGPLPMEGCPHVLGLS